MDSKSKEYNFTIQAFEDKMDNNTIQEKLVAPLQLESLLALTPNTQPVFPFFTQDLEGNDVVLGDPKATRAIIAVMNAHAVIGGAACHWGGPAALAEIMAATHSVMFASGSRWFDNYNFVNDAGHTENGVYALRANLGFDKMTLDTIKGFRSIDSKLTGHGEQHINPEGVLLSNGPLGSSIAQSQGLAMADKLSGKFRTTIQIVSDGAAMEGEAKEAFASIPGLAAKSLLNPYLMILSDNNTKLSGRIDEDSFSMEGTFTGFEALGWNVIKVSEGNDINAVYPAVQKAILEAQANPLKPVCLWVKTVKGIGNKATEQDASGGHGFPGSAPAKLQQFIQEIYANEKAPAELLALGAEVESIVAAASEAKSKAKSKAASSSDSTIKKVARGKVQAGFATGAIAARKAGYPVVSLSADLAGSTGMKPFVQAYPELNFDLGVAESNIFSTSAGMAKAGFIPIADTFAQFGATKGALPLIMASLSRSPVIGVLSHAGFQDAADGASHQATTYFSTLAGIPNLSIINPSSSDEAEALMIAAIENIAKDRQAGKDGESVVFYTGRESFPVSYDAKPVSWNSYQVFGAENAQVVICSTGYLLEKSLIAQSELKESGVNAAVIHMPFVNKTEIDSSFVSIIQQAQGRVITFEDHQVCAGFGSMLTHDLAQIEDLGVSLSVRSLGVQGGFGQSAYLADELYASNGMDVQGLKAAAQNLLK